MEWGREIIFLRWFSVVSISGHSGINFSRDDFEDHLVVVMTLESQRKWQLGKCNEKQRSISFWNCRTKKKIGRIQKFKLNLE